MGRWDWAARLALILALAPVPGLAGAPTVPSAATAAAPAPKIGPLTPREAFAAPVVFSPRLSPNGRFLAFLRMVDGAPAVVVLDLAKPDAAPNGIGFGKGLQLNWVAWKSNDRLIIGVSRPMVLIIGDVALNYIGGRYMVASDRDGAHQVVMFKSDKESARRAGQLSALLDPLRKDPDHILAVNDTAAGVSAVWRVDVRTGAADLWEKGDGRTVGWDADSDGVIVGRRQLSGQTLTLQGRAPGESAWTDIVRLRQKSFEKETADFDLLAPGDRSATSYVVVEPKEGEPGEYRTLHLYDFRTHSLGPDLWPGLKGDVTGIVTSEETHRLQGVCHVDDVERCEFRDPKAQTNLAGIAKYLGGDKSLDIISWTDDARWALLAVTGPDDPGSYVIYDWKTHEVRNLGLRYADLGPERLGRRVAWTYTAADGTPIRGYLTYPPKAPDGRLPLVVMPHGGPMARDTLDFDAWAELVASRGYLVFQPNFRGSGGFGRSWLQAGWRQWGGLMQSDVFDGVEALVSQGKADPGRVCAVGASYGGYAALMQGALHPDAYRCIVSWAGVSDLSRHLASVREREGADSAVYAYEVKQLGDPIVNEKALIAASPVTFAAGYRPSVLLVHGKDDEIVRPEQSRLMEAALKRAHKNVQLLLFANEGHPNFDLDDQDKAFTAVLAFLDAHIGAGVRSDAKP